MKRTIFKLYPKHKFMSSPNNSEIPNLLLCFRNTPLLQFFLNKTNVLNILIWHGRIAKENRNLTWSKDFIGSL
jgi:hypothetical protein